jgi:hypothetical protein
MKHNLLLLFVGLTVLPPSYAQNLDVLAAHRWKARDTVYSDKNPSGRLITEQYIDSIVVNPNTGTYRARGKTIVFAPDRQYTSSYRISGKILTSSDKKVVISYEEHGYEKTMAGEKLCPTKGRLRLYKSKLPGKYYLKGELMEQCSRSFQLYVFSSEDKAMP